MKRTILAGFLVVATGIACLMAEPQAQQKGQKGQAQQAPSGQPKGPAPKSQGEAQALMALQSAQGNPDATIKACEDLLTKYADTDFKEIALYMEAMAYQQKGDSDKAQIFAERVLQVNPNDFQANLMIGEILAQHTRENDLDREEKLTRADKLLNSVIEQLKTAPKPNPQLPDAQWEEAKKYTTAEAHNDLGLIGLTRKKYDVAISEFKTASDLDPQPAYQVRLASAYQQSGKNDEAIAICDKLLADASLHPQIRQVAQAVKAAATQGKK